MKTKGLMPLLLLQGEKLYIPFDSLVKTARFFTYLFNNLIVKSSYSATALMLLLWIYRIVIFLRFHHPLLSVLNISSMAKKVWQGK